MSSDTRAAATQQRLDNLDTATMKRIAERVTSDETATFLNWHYTPMKAGAGGGAFNTAVYRFTGEIRQREMTGPASLILKIVHAAEQQHPSDNYYWKREAEVYRSDLLNSLSGPFVGSQCYGVIEYSDASWLWLEAVDESLPGAWPLAQFETVAGHLGQFNGTYAVAPAMPDFPWLSQDFIRQDVSMALSDADFARCLEHPSVRRFLPAPGAERVLRLLDERETFLDVFDGMSQTLCHFDAFRHNLFARLAADGSPQTVAIDWSFAGIGPIGVELVSLMWVSLLYEEYPLDRATELDRHVFRSYVDGLRGAGWGRRSSARAPGLCCCRRATPHRHLEHSRTKGLER